MRLLLGLLVAIAGCDSVFGLSRDVDAASAVCTPIETFGQRLNTFDWSMTTSGNSSFATVDTNRGVLRLTLPVSSGEARIDSLRSWTAAGGAVEVELVTAPKLEAGTLAELRLRSLDNAEWATIGMYDAGVSFLTSAGVDPQPIRYVAVDHRWLRIRQVTAGTVGLWFETSPDGVLWTARGTIQGIQATEWFVTLRGEVRVPPLTSNPGIAEFDNLRITRTDGCLEP